MTKDHYLSSNKSGILDNSLLNLSIRSKSRIHINHILTLLFRWFEYSMVGVILINSLTLSLYDYKDRDALTTYN